MGNSNPPKVGKINPPLTNTYYHAITIDESKQKKLGVRTSDIIAHVKKNVEITYKNSTQESDILKAIERIHAGFQEIIRKRSTEVPQYLQDFLENLMKL